MEIAIKPAKYSLECSTIKVTLDVMGGKWKPLILFLLHKNKVMRFSELKNQIEGITQKMLTQQLRELESDRIISRKIYPVIPPKVEYSITEHGKTIIPILMDMETWGKDHRSFK